MMVGLFSFNIREIAMLPNHFFSFIFNHDMDKCEDFALEEFTKSGNANCELLVD